MADYFILASPSGPLALTREEYTQALAKASELVPPGSADLKPANGAPPPANPTEKAFLTAAELALLTGKPKRWWLAEARSGRVDHRRWGRSVRFPRSVLDDNGSQNRCSSSESVRDNNE